MRRWHWQSLVIVLGIVALSTIIQLALRVRPLQAQGTPQSVQLSGPIVDARYMRVYRITDGSNVCYATVTLDGTSISCLKR